MAIELIFYLVIF